ncbi:MAG: hypothetical protein R2867_45115 [Caldilineaceae bacterium]
MISSSLLAPALLDQLAVTAQIDLTQGYQWVPAPRLSSPYHPTVEVELPLFVTGIADHTQLARLAQTLANAYPIDHIVTVALDQAADRVSQCQLGTLADGGAGTILGLDQPVALCVPPLPEGSSFSATSHCRPSPFAGWLSVGS